MSRRAKGREVQIKKLKEIEVEGSEKQYEFNFAVKDAVSEPACKIKYKRVNGQFYNWGW